MMMSGTRYWEVFVGKVCGEVERGGELPIWLVLVPPEVLLTPC
jgi:hypothetical protein